jgi:hypothetical protein
VRTLLPLDDVLGCPRETTLALLAPCPVPLPERQGISRLLQVEEKTSKRKRSA